MNSFEKKKKILKYNNHKEILKDKTLDFVIIASNTKSLYPLAKKILESKKNVIIEKPIANKIKQVQNLLIIAKKNRKFVIPFFNFRFAKDFLLIKEILDNKLLGKIFLIKRNVSYFNSRADWQSKNMNLGGIINAAAIHQIDQLTQLAGYECASSFGSLKNNISKGDAPDYIKFFFKMRNNCDIDLETSWCSSINDFNWSIYGTKGTLRQYNNYIDLKYYKKYKKVSQKNIRSYLSDEKYEWIRKKINIQDKKNKFNSYFFYKKIYKFFIKKNINYIPIKLESIINLMKFIEKNIYKKAIE